MWCPACRADVAAELSSDNRRYCCARCQTELGIAAGALDRVATPPRLHDTERNARELLARWSTQNLLEPAASVGPSNEFSQVEREIASPATRSDLRFDAAHSSTPAPKGPLERTRQSERTQQSASNERETTRSESDSGDEPAERKPRRRKLRRPKLANVPEEALPTTASRHDELVRTAIAQPQPARTNWTSMAGQLCAYGGVGLLTCGTVLVLSGYFGGPTHYAPTGWLIAAVGQMLLFLGVVTLVSGGMEQTVDEVAWRIDYLAERIVHLEHMVQERELRDQRLQRRPRPPRDNDDRRADAA